MEWAELASHMLEALIVVVLWWQRRHSVEIATLIREVRNGNGELHEMHEEQKHRSV